MSRATYLQKIIYRVTYFIFILTTVAGWFNISADNVLMKFDKLNVEQEITGWGTSAAWWSQIAGDSENAEELARLLYSEEGLGLNIYRYNVGAGEKDQEHSVILDYAPHNYDWRASESFLVYNEETGEYEYDWTQDAAAQKMLDLCLNYGCIDTVVLFANSSSLSPSNLTLPISFKYILTGSLILVAESYSTFPKSSKLVIKSDSTSPAKISSSKSISTSKSDCSPVKSNSTSSA